jgi:hypothetical protein
MSRNSEAHRRSCQSCHEEYEKFLAVISAVREFTSSSVELSASVRREIAHQAAERAVRHRWTLRLPIWAPRMRTSILAAAAVSIVLVLAALPITLRHGVDRGKNSDIHTLNITSNGGVVRVAWSNGSRDMYTVYKSYDPRSLQGARAHLVRGNVWLDAETDRSPIVFYRIE